MNPKNFKNFKHAQCNYIYNHQYKLNDFENDSLNFYTYSKIPNCPFCNKKKNVKYVVKFNKSRTYKNVANITGKLIYNAYGTNCKPNQHFVCEKCDKYF